VRAELDVCYDAPGALSTWTQQLPTDKTMVYRAFEAPAAATASQEHRAFLRSGAQGVARVNTGEVLDGGGGLADVVARVVVVVLVRPDHPAVRLAVSHAGSDVAGLDLAVDLALRGRPSWGPTRGSRSGRRRRVGCPGRGRAGCGSCRHRRRRSSSRSVSRSGSAGWGPSSDLSTSEGSGRPAGRRGRRSADSSPPRCCRRRPSAGSCTSSVRDGLHRDLV
jgi:hypothetical protein